MKRVVLSVTNDLVNDRRVQRSIAVLQEQGFQPTFVGRELPDSRPFDFDFPTRRFSLWFHKGFLFYATYNLRLFLYLLFSKPFDLYWANDLDTLLPNYLVSKLFGKPLVYDSHEYFKGVPEIQSRPIVKGVWTLLEAWIYPRLKYRLTVNESIAQLLAEDYGDRPTVVRNISESYLPEERSTRADLQLPEEAFLLINQGAGINVDRGMEEAFEALHYLEPEVHLVLVGRGDVLPLLKKKARQENLQDRVHFIDALPYAEMLQYTLNADIGLSLDKDTNLNYRFSLPNKLFDYIKCGLPTLSSSVIEVRRIVEESGIGESTAVDPKGIAAKVKEMRKNYDRYRANMVEAARKHNWQRESQVLANFIASIPLQK